MTDYHCPEICAVDHEHIEKDRECSFLKEAFSRKGKK